MDFVSPCSCFVPASLHFQTCYPDSCLMLFACQVVLGKVCNVMCYFTIHSVVMKVHLMIPNMSGRTGSRACPVSSGVCGLGSAVLVPFVFLHSVLTGTRLCWGGWKSSALSFWTPITTPLTSSSHTCQVSPPCASTRTRSTTCLCLWRRSGESFRASGESIVSSCSCITKPSCPSYNSSGFLPFMVEGSSA